MTMKAKIFKNPIAILFEMYHNTGSTGDFCLIPLVFLLTLIDCRKGRRGCWGCSLSLANLLAGMPRQLKGLSKASLPNREVL